MSAPEAASTWWRTATARAAWSSPSPAEPFGAERTGDHRPEPHLCDAAQVCCQDDAVLDQPPAVLEMLARYERMRREQGFGWGEEDLAEFWGWARFSRLGPAFADFVVSQDWAAAVRTAVGDHPPAGVVRILVAADGSLSARTGRPRPVVRGVTAQIEVIVDSAADDDVAVMVDAQEVAVPPA